MNWLINFHNINTLSVNSLPRTFANSEEPGEILLMWHIIRVTTVSKDNLIFR